MPLGRLQRSLSPQLPSRRRCLRSRSSRPSVLPALHALSVLCTLSDPRTAPHRSSSPFGCGRGHTVNGAAITPADRPNVRTTADTRPSRGAPRGTPPPPPHKAVASRCPPQGAELGRTAAPLQEVLCYRPLCATTWQPTRAHTTTLSSPVSCTDMASVPALAAKRLSKMHTTPTSLALAPTASVPTFWAISAAP